MTIATPAVLAFYADSKYKNSFSVLLPTQNQQSEKMCLIFEKRGNTPKKARGLIENPFIRYVI